MAIDARFTTVEGSSLSAVEWSPPITSGATGAAGQRYAFRAVNALFDGGSWMAADMDVDEAVARHLAENIADLTYPTTVCDLPSLSTALGQMVVVQGSESTVPSGVVLVRILPGGGSHWFSAGSGPDYRVSLEVSMRLDGLPESSAPNAIYSAWSVLAASNQVTMPSAVAYTPSGNKWPRGG